MKPLSKEIKIGAAFIIASTFLYVGIMFLKGKSIFSKQYTYYAIYNNISGLNTSAAVTTNGYRIGSVNDIQYDYTVPGRIVVTLGINKELRIPEGSQALLASSLLEGASIDLHMATSTEYHTAGDTLTTGTEHGFMGQIENNILPLFSAIIPKIDTLICSIHTITANPAINQSLSNVEDLTRKLSFTAEELNRLLENEFPHLISSFQNTGENLSHITSELRTTDMAQIMAHLDTTIQNLQALTVQLRSDESSVGRLLNDSTFYTNLNKVCNNANALIEDVKQHPSRYINISVFGRNKE